MTSCPTMPQHATLPLGVDVIDPQQLAVPLGLLAQEKAKPASWACGTLHACMPRKTPQHSVSHTKAFPQHCQHACNLYSSSDLI